MPPVRVAVSNTEPPTTSVEDDSVVEIESDVTVKGSQALLSRLLSASPE